MHSKNKAQLPERDKMNSPKKTTEKAIMEFLSSELSIPKDLYHKFMQLDKLAGMTDERLEILLNKAEQHFGKKLLIPSYAKMFNRPSRILNGFNQKGKMYE